jgi:broad specificity phosphatase PhoE
MGIRFSDYMVERGIDKRIPGGESLVELQQRCWGFISRLADKYGKGEIAVVSHYFVIMSTVSAALNLPLDNITRLRLSTGSLSIISFNDKGVRLELFNDTGCFDNRP